MNPLDEDIIKQAENLYETLLAAGMNNPETVLMLLTGGAGEVEKKFRALARCSLRAAIWFREEVDAVRNEE